MRPEDALMILARARLQAEIANVFFRASSAFQNREAIERKQSDRTTELYLFDFS